MPKTFYKFPSQAEFAKIAGTSQQSISRGLRRGVLVWAYTEDGRKDGIDPEDPINAAYIDKIANSNSGNRLDVQAAKDAKKRLSGKDAGSEKASSKAAFDAAFAMEKAENAEIARLNKALKQVDLAKSLNKLIPLEFVMQFWQAVLSGMHNYFIPLGPRISEEIIAICGVSDPQKEREVREHIEEEVLSALKSVQSRALEVPKDLGLPFG
jgi:hypothetical protein